MENELLAQLNQWHNDEKYEEIIATIMAIPAINWDYDLSGQLARAHNNNEEYDKAIEILMTISEKGQEDPLWHFRVGYAYFYKDMPFNALPFFEKSAALGDETAIEFSDFCKRELRYKNSSPPIR